MTIDEAIKHCEEVADGMTAQGKCSECANEHRQLAEWLRDYKRLKEQEPTITSTEDNAEMTYPQVEGITPTVALPDVDKDFQIGDEVRIIGSDPIYDDCDVGWVIRNASERVKTMYVMRNDGSADEENKAEWYKTGRHNAMLAEVIKQLPHVKPQERTGHWTRELIRNEKGGCIGAKMICSECDNDNKHDEYMNFCPNCGTKMEVETNGWFDK